jgi:Putative restriction endonuclease
MACETQNEPREVSAEDSAGRVAYEEFLNWPGDNHHVEWVNGRIVFKSPVTKPHEIVRRFLYTLINLFVEVRHLGEVSAHNGCAQGVAVGLAAQPRARRRSRSFGLQLG